MFPVGGSSLLVCFGSLPPMMGNQQVIDDEVSYFAAQPLAGGEVEAEMLAGENAAQSSLFGCSREAVE